MAATDSALEQVKPQTSNNADVQLLRQQVIVELLKSSDLSSDAIKSWVRMCLKAGVLQAKDVLPELHSLCIEKGLDLPSAPDHTVKEQLAVLDRPSKPSERDGQRNLSAVVGGLLDITLEASKGCEKPPEPLPLPNRSSKVEPADAGDGKPTSEPGDCEGGNPFSTSEQLGDLNKKKSSRRLRAATESTVSSSPPSTKASVVSPAFLPQPTKVDRCSSSFSSLQGSPLAAEAPGPKPEPAPPSAPLPRAHRRSTNPPPCAHPPADAVAKPNPTPTPTPSPMPTWARSPSATSPAASRFERDYEQLELLGRGSFGEVWRVRSRIDRKEYAVKIVQYKFRPEVGPYDHPVLREAQTWASCDYPGSVRYHASWVEVLEGPASTSTSTSASPGLAFEAFSTSSSPRSTPSGTEGTPTSTSSVEVELSPVSNGDIVFEGSTSCVSGPSPGKQQQQQQQQLQEQQQHMQQKMQNTQEHEQEKRKPPKEPAESEPSQSLRPRPPALNGVSRTTTGTTSRHWCHAKLFLQAELVRGGTLRSWIDRRNSELEALGGKAEALPPELGSSRAESIFRQLVDSVQQLHLRGLVHRDIKPGNILLTEDGKVRLADFGLVKEDRAARSATPKLVKVASHQERDEELDREEHTRGVGTLSYLSPEQRLGATYDYKVDVFALGLVLAELLFPVRTVMARAKLFEALHQGLHAPEDEAPLYSEVVDLLYDMIAPDPALRPHAADIHVALRSKHFA